MINIFKSSRGNIEEDLEDAEDLFHKRREQRNKKKPRRKDTMIEKTLYSIQFNFVSAKNIPPPPKPKASLLTKLPSPTTTTNSSSSYETTEDSYSYLILFYFDHVEHETGMVEETSPGICDFQGKKITIPVRFKNFNQNFKISLLRVQHGSRNRMCLGTLEEGIYDRTQSPSSTAVFKLLGENGSCIELSADIKATSIDDD